MRVIRVCFGFVVGDIAADHVLFFFDGRFDLFRDGRFFDKGSGSGSGGDGLLNDDGSDKRRRCWISPRSSRRSDRYSFHFVGQFVDGFFVFFFSRRFSGEDLAWDISNSPASILLEFESQAESEDSNIGEGKNGDISSFPGE